MRFNLAHVWEQAVSDYGSANLDTRLEQARLSYGIKIVYRAGEIIIYNTTIGGDYYIELSGTEYLIFEEHGWKVGCYRMVLDNCIERLDHIERKIRVETNSKKSRKGIIKLKQDRERVMNNYRTITTKINKYGNN